jgi:hypothetical protein
LPRRLAPPRNDGLGSASFARVLAKKPRKRVEVDAVTMQFINFVTFASFTGFQRLQPLAATHE